MIEYKFRGKREDANIWVYGYVFKTHKGNPWFDETTWIFNEDGKFKVEPETVGQYIGLEDKNGVEIYEGDLIKSSHTDLWYKIVFDGRYKGQSIEHDYKTARTCISDISTIDMHFYEVCGNIHEQESHT